MQVGRIQSWSKMNLQTWDFETKFLQIDSHPNKCEVSRYPLKAVDMSWVSGPLESVFFFSLRLWTGPAALAYELQLNFGNNTSWLNRRQLEAGPENMKF